MLEEWQKKHLKEELERQKATYRAIAKLPVPDPGYSINRVMAQLRVPDFYAPTFLKVVSVLIHNEEPVFTPLTSDFENWSIEDFNADFQTFKYRQRFHENPSNALHHIEHSIVSILRPFVASLPPASPDAIFFSSLASVIPTQALTDALNALSHSISSQSFFGHLAWLGAFRAHKSYYEFTRDDTLSFFSSSALRDILHLPIPVGLPERQRFSHTHILGSTGSGKTTLIQNLIAYDLKSDAGVIVIDPHKQLISSLSNLKLNRPVVLIDPVDAPAINIFDVERTNDPVERERVFASVVKMLSYLFREGDTPPTGKQMMVFQYLCRLVLAFPDTRGRKATLLDLFDFLSNPAPFQKDINQLQPIAQAFFKDFNSKGQEYKNTAAELRYRLHTILSNPSLERIFTAPNTKFDIGQEMDKGTLVLINADQSFMGDMHAVFGKIFLALIMQAARQRKPNSRPVFVYVDEAHRFLDEHATDLLTDARKFRVGCILAHQHLGQIGSSTVKGALQGTAIKFAGGVRAEDARALANDMRTTVDDLLNLPPYHFMFYSQGKSLPILPSSAPLKDFSPMSDSEYQAMLQANKRFSHVPEPRPQDQEPDEDVSDTW